MVPYVGLARHWTELTYGGVIKPRGNVPKSPKNKMAYAPVPNTPAHWAFLSAILA